MELYQAGSFAGDNQRGMLYSTGPQNVLFSFAHDTARKTCDLVAGSEGKEKMQLFLAGDWSPTLHEQVCDAAGERNLLCTNAARASRDRADYFATKRADYSILVDSGAFTAYKQGTKIDLEAYIDYAMTLRMLATNPERIEFIALDVIAGTPEQGKTGTIPIEEKRQACIDGFNNFVEMSNRGVYCLPTFHRDDEHIDDWKWLFRICDEVIERGEKRMCLAPRVDGSPTSVKMRWLNECFKQMTKRYGRELWKRFWIHGLGISSVEMMEAYPFYSVDSTGWLWAATNCTFKEFDGTRLNSLQKTANGEPNNWAERHGRKFVTARTIQCIDHYKTAEEGCKTALDGGYWFGAMAIVADVRLQRHITELWTKRGVTFE